MKRILILEDDVALGEVVATILEDAGYKTLVIQRSEALFPYILEFPPNLCIMDYTLSGIGHGQAYLLIRLSGNNEEMLTQLLSYYTQVTETIETHPHYIVLEKPFTIESLLKKVEKLVYQL
ncbi:hypothetical protein AAFN85_31345 [Mucilaginibacter sp. CAU 1740]|uniref:hypothetical protein n=1 Tax=Mucilaginibacter sp. CAU 1740 TaxID=3140365 RepID=UPI00325A8189